MYKRAIIICGGKGSRLLPFTRNIPKGLLQVGDYPVLEIIVRQLKYYDFSDITFSVYHFAQSIIDYFGNGSKWNLRITYSVEDFPLGTAGPLKILKDLPDNLIVINCDILADLNFKDFFDYHVQNRNLFTIAAYKKKYPIPYGVLQTNASGQLLKIDEKPEWIQINAGIYATGKRIVDFIPNCKTYGMDQLIYDLLRKNQPMAVYPFEGYWQDIGSKEEYKKAIAESQLHDQVYMQKQN
ncbi:sugar phosphate nucleotidyltransferase [Mucilaginibacter gossypii]|uniref:sugar phosphate nucleotidyltransferase n=1 Tax=Mucilaginibacter gossypii TaxID=551996 RepID=UPI00167749B7|nr:MULTISPECIES: sugar phosphate nucleotidyltransferase [Mucilaginibacter]QTE39731.1 sugar phosphate nucleotidyltransferase [Mucilaginibacter gossypii]